MKILLDENLPHNLRKMIPGHDVFTPAYMGWSSIKNGVLLGLAAAKSFDVMVTKDSGIYYEQHLPNLPVAVIILKAKTNKIEDIGPLVPLLIDALGKVKPKTVVRIG